MSKLIIANWKMNLELKQAVDFCKKLANVIADDTQIIIAPPSIYLSYLKENFSMLNFSSQDVSAVDKEYGSYTGEISSKMLKNLAIKYVITGHSERRNYFGETDKQIYQKASGALKQDLVPIICIGENLQVKDAGSSINFLINQITSCIPANSDNEIIVAYEPIWAIGTGVNADLDYIAKVADALRPYISKVAKRYRLVYGGSVTSQTIEHLSTIKEIDGFLVGGSSLNFDEFLKIVKAYA